MTAWTERVLAINALALVSARHSSLEAFAVRFLAITLLAVAARSMARDVRLRLESIVFALEDFENGFPSNSFTLRPWLVLALSVLGACALGAASGIITEALAVSLEAIALSTLATLAFCYSGLALVNFLEQSFLSHRISKNLSQLLLQPILGHSE